MFAYQQWNDYKLSTLLKSLNLVFFVQIEMSIWVHQNYYLKPKKIFRAKPDLH